MASGQLQKPCEQTCKQKYDENKFGMKETETACGTLMSSSEENHGSQQGHGISHTRVAYQPRNSQTHAHHHEHGKHNTQMHGQDQTHGCDGNNEKTFKEKLTEAKKKVKTIFKKREKNGTCDHSSSSSSSSSDSESDYDNRKKKN